MGNNTIAVFSIVKNEADYIGYSIMSMLDHVDAFYYYDGNSTDGTIEIIEYIKTKYDKQNKIHLFKNKDCKDLQGDYVRLWNELLSEIKEDFCFYCHPDMISINAEKIKEKFNLDTIRYTVNMVSFAGTKRDKIITAGREKKWATIYRNDLGLHFAGYYGAVEEDFYFSAITGNEHIFYDMLEYLPYKIVNTDLILYHYCDCKPCKRRLDRMVSVLKNTNPTRSEEEIKSMAVTHPRIHFNNGVWNRVKFEFIKNDKELPVVFEKYKEFESLKK